MYPLLIILSLLSPMVLCTEIVQDIINTHNDGGNAGMAENEDFDALTYLERAGYLDDIDVTSRRFHAPDDVKRALIEFQQFAGLPVTKHLDKATVAKMKQPRCGVPDVVKPSQRLVRTEIDPFAPQSYKLNLHRWWKEDITYKFNIFSAKLSRDQQRIAISKSLKKWSQVSSLNFKETYDSADIKIKFVRGNHGDKDSFDGKGGTLAHAFFPGPGIGGDAHFDEDENWTVNSRRGMSLESVATHELGHSLGLAHSDNPKAIMYAWYHSSDDNKLHDDDIRGIQARYGPRNDSLNHGQHQTTSRPTGTKCDITKFDAIVYDDNKGMHAIAGQNIYMITQSGLQIKQKVTNVYFNGPSTLDAILYNRYTKKTYLFRGQYYWRYSRVGQDAGFPKKLGKDFKNINAAFMRNNGQMFVFQGNKISRWEESWQRYPGGWPLSISSVFGLSPDNVDAAFQTSNGLLYLFQNNRYWKYWNWNGPDVLAPGYPKNMRSFWLGCGRKTGDYEEPLFGGSVGK